MERVYYELRDQGRFKEALDIVRYEWDRLHRRVVDDYDCGDHMERAAELGHVLAKYMYCWSDRRPRLIREKFLLDAARGGVCGCNA
jgi:hypothetical protein